MKINYRNLVWLLVPLLGIYSPIFAQKAQASEKGFKKIFDGKTLKGWEGDPVYWKAENGSIVGVITPETLLKRNTFIIYRDAKPSDFELKCEVKITKDGNTGINYRSEELLPDLPFALKGYQADIDGSDTYTGQNYEERGRGFLAKRGEISVLKSDMKPTITGSLGNSDSLKAKIKKGDWNEIHIVVKDNHLKHYINGVLMSEVTDEDAKNRKYNGVLGLQVHVMPKMKVEYRKLMLKQL